MYSVEHNAVLIRRDDCPRLFLVFGGLVGRGMGFKPLEFVKRAGLDERNLVILKDPRDTGFLAGCSERLRSFEQVLDWLSGVVAGFAHVRKIYSIGMSSGGVAAMLAANRLGGECSVIFAPRMHSLRIAGATEEVRASATPVAAPSLAERILLSTYPLERRLRAGLRLPARAPLPPRSVLEAGRADFQPMLSALEASRNSAVHNIYYVASNAVDRVTVEYLAGRCKQVRAHRVTVPDGPDGTKQKVGWDHELIRILLAQGQLRSLIDLHCAGG
jgi:hypothetical protein